MSNPVDDFYRLVDDGRLHKNRSISIGLPKMEEYMEGLNQGTSYLICGASGTYKSSILIHSFLYHPIMHGDRDFHCILFSLEMTREQVLSRLLSIYIFEAYGVEIGFKQMFSRGKDTTITDEQYAILQDCRPILDRFCEHITFYTDSLTAEKFASVMDSELKKYGTFDNGSYIPNDPNMILEVAVDHLNLVQTSNGKSKKECMDAISNMSVQIRNKTKIVSPVFLMQLNRNGANGERLRANQLEPNNDDIKGTGSVLEDTHVCLLLFSPFAHKLNSYRGYDIQQLQGRCVSMICSKNRFGTVNVCSSMFAAGEVCSFKELPKSDEIYDYSKYQTIDWLLQKDNDKKDEPQSNINLTL